MELKTKAEKKSNISENCLKVLEKRYLMKDKDGKIIEYAILPSGKAFVNLFYCSAEAGKVYRNLLHPKQN